MEGDSDTISFQPGKDSSNASSEGAAVEEIVKPAEPSETDPSSDTVSTAAAAGRDDDVLEIPKDGVEDYGNCFVEVVGKGMYRPTCYQPPAPPVCASKAEVAPKVEVLPENAGGWASFVKQVKDGIVAGQKDRTKERCAKTMKLFNDLPRDQAPFVPPEDVVPVTDFRCNCVVDCDVDGTKSPYIAEGWLTVTQTALIFNGALVLSPARPDSVPEPKEVNVAFAIDIAAIVSVAAAHCDDGDEAEVLAGTRMPNILACDSIDSASAVILFDRSNHAHQFYDFVWCFTNYAPDAIRSIVYQCNIPDSSAAAAPHGPQDDVVTMSAGDAAVA